MNGVAQGQTGSYKRPLSRSHGWWPTFIMTRSTLRVRDCARCHRDDSATASREHLRPQRSKRRDGELVALALAISGGERAVVNETIAEYCTPTTSNHAVTQSPFTSRDPKATRRNQTLVGLRSAPPLLGRQRDRRPTSLPSAFVTYDELEVEPVRPQR